MLTLGRTRNSQDDFLFIAKDGVTIATTKRAARKSHRLSCLIDEEAKASDYHCGTVKAPLRLLAVQWLEYANSKLTFKCKRNIPMNRLMLRTML